MTALRSVAICLALVPLAAVAEPADELHQLDYFLGTWHCDGADYASPGGPTYPIERVITASNDLGGQWLTLHWEETQTAENPNPWNVEMAFTYEPARKSFAFIFRDNTRAWSTGTTPGWDGNQLIVVGEYPFEGRSVPYRDVYTKHADGTHGFVTETQLNGQWMANAEATCHR